MKKTILLTAISITVLVLLLVLFLFIFRIFNGPFVGFSEKRNVSNIVENYLTKKYGNHNFKVTDVDYDYDMETLFDYSTKTGYLVSYKSDLLESSASVVGVYPNIKGINDWFLEYYYFEDESGWADYDKMKSLAPKGKIESIVFNKIKNEFDKNIQKVNISSVTFETPDNFGRIPTIEEIKSRADLYWVSGIDYTTIFELDEKEEMYEIKLKEYLNKYFGGEWEVYLREKDNLNYVYCSGTSFSIEKILNDK